MSLLVFLGRFTGDSFKLEIIHSGSFGFSYFTVKRATMVLSSPFFYCVHILAEILKCKIIPGKGMHFQEHLGKKHQVLKLKLKEYCTIFRKTNSFLNACLNTALLFNKR